MDARTKAIIAHFTFVGWIIALIINSNNKEPFTDFYIRQTLGIFLVGIIFSWIPVLNIISWLIVFAFWLLSLVYAIQGQMKPIPYGEYFQQWFRGL